MYKLKYATPFVFLLIGFILHYVLPTYAEPFSDTFLFLAVLVHSANIWGIQSTTVYAITAMIIGYSAEYFGIHTGLVFGPYHYNPVNNIGMISGIPFSIPIIYVIFLYAGNLLSIGISEKLLSIKNLWMLSIMTGCILMLQSMVSDPIQSMVYQVWIWDTHGDYFNVPLHNFIGWFMVFGIMTFITVYLSWHKTQKNIHLQKNALYFPFFLFFTLIIFGFTAALSVPEKFRHIGHVSEFISIFVLSPYLLLAWFNNQEKS